ncbi:MAG: DUF4139 domain-containing protein [Planctomycetota bacterium]|jgi:hypothetical protein
MKLGRIWRAAMVVVCLAAAAPAAEDEGVAVTVYRESDELQAARARSGGIQYFDPYLGQYVTKLPGWGVVKVRRKLSLQEGLNVVRFTDVAAGIDPTTVLVTSLTDPGALFCAEQNFEYDLVSPQRILQKFVDHEITVVTEDGSVTGTLLSYDSQNLVLRTSDSKNPVRILSRTEGFREIRFPELPGGLITRPTLVWHLLAKKAGEHLVQAAYHTKDMTWRADYTATVSEDEATIDLAAWVTLENRSGASFVDAKLKLVAGDVRRIMPPSWRAQMGYMAGGVGGDGTLSERPRFEEKDLFEYHLYTLDRPTTLADRSEKQLELFSPVAGVPIGKRYVYYGGRGVWGHDPYRYSRNNPIQDRAFGMSTHTKVDVYLEIPNRQASGLGRPLPAGRMRVYKKDVADGSMEFIGEDRVDHTPKDELLRIRLGSAFDLTAERRQTDFKVNHNEEWLRESFEIKVRNHKDEAVEVVLQEDLYRWLSWEIEKKSRDFTKVHAQRIIFPVKVEPDGEAVVTYTVKYTW